MTNSRKWLHTDWHTLKKYTLFVFLIFVEMFGIIIYNSDYWIMRVDSMDLSAQMFYKVKFSIAAKEPSSDLLWKIVRHVKKWQTKKWNKKGCEAILPVASSIWTSIKNGGRIITDSKIVYIESEFFSPDSGNTQLWACRIMNYWDSSSWAGSGAKDMDNGDRLWIWRRECCGFFLRTLLWRSSRLYRTISRCA